jgi:thioesterase domain-containing protein
MSISERSNTVVAPTSFHAAALAGEFEVETVRSGGAQGPLFLVHDIHGRMSYGRSLVPHVDPEIPIYALPAVSLYQGASRTIEHLAARWVRRIRVAQPEGPYRLVGWLSGGTLAYEIAVQLLGQDQQVEFLGLIDSVCPGVERSLGSMQDYVVQPLPIALHLFSTDDSQTIRGVRDPLLGWGKVIPRERLKVALPQGAALGQALNQAIGAAQDCGPTSIEAGYEPLISVQIGRRSQVPILCIPGAGSSITTFTSWADALGESWPMHGLQPRGVEGLLLPHSTVQAATARYLRAIDEVCPEGPVHLLGHSFGGWIALELAQVFRTRGRKVASVTMLDVEAPDSTDLIGKDYTSIQVVLELTNVIQMTAREPLGIRAADLAGLDHSGRMQLLHKRLVRAGIMPQRSRPEVLIGPMRTFAAALRTAYQPAAPYPEPINLVTVSDPSIDADADLLRRQKLLQDWRRWAPQITSWHGPGNHMSLLQPPHVLAVVDWWRGIIQSNGHQ